MQPADGLDYEVCFGSGDKMRVSLVWDTPEQLDAFGARLMPILARWGSIGSAGSAPGAQHHQALETLP